MHGRVSESSVLMSRCVAHLIIMLGVTVVVVQFLVSILGELERLRFATGSDVCVAGDLWCMTHVELLTTTLVDLLAVQLLLCGDEGGRLNLSDRSLIELAGRCRIV